MIETNSNNKLHIIQTYVDKLKPSWIFGDCLTDAANVIKHLTNNMICRSGNILSLNASMFDSDSSDLIILVGRKYRQVQTHYVALMDYEYIVDLGRNSCDRVFLEQLYYSHIRSLQH
ncbi:MAG: hypothetical protein Q7R95_01625 [bacterium]|nr:hypothetical protein [bacterium]